MHCFDLLPLQLVSVVPELDEELEFLDPLIFLGGAAFFADAALEGAAVES